MHDRSRLAWETPDDNRCQRLRLVSPEAIESMEIARWNLVQSEFFWH